MRFTVIIPVYNVEPYLRECLDSVLAQSFLDFEVICVNDGSTDGSGKILEDYAEKDRRVVVLSQNNAGLSAARNRGLQEAKGDYIFFLDSDDWLSVDALELLSNQIDGQDIIAFNGKRVFESGKKEEPDGGISEYSINGWDYFEKYVLQGCKFSFVCVVLRIYRREYLLKHNLLFREGICHEDNLYTPLSCYYADKVTSIPDVLYFYRIREGSIMTARNPKRGRDVITVANELASFFEDKKVERASLNRYIAGLYFRSFMPENKMPEVEKELVGMIDWERFRSVCTYPRHKRMFKFLNMSTGAFRTYLWVENMGRWLLKRRTE